MTVGARATAAELGRLNLTFRALSPPATNRCQLPASVDHFGHGLGPLRRQLYAGDASHRRLCPRLLVEQPEPAAGGDQFLVRGTRLECRLFDNGVEGSG